MNILWRLEDFMACVMVLWMTRIEDDEGHSGWVQFNNVVFDRYRIHGSRCEMPTRQPLDDVLSTSFIALSLFAIGCMERMVFTFV